MAVRQKFPIIRVSQSIADSLMRHGYDWSVQPLAIAIENLGAPTFAETDRWAKALAGAVEQHNGIDPLIVICDQDVAMAVGQLLRRYLPQRQLVILDGLSISDGDFIDIGKPLSSKSALPVVVKELIFNR